MQTRSSDEISVCLSVRLSVKRVHCDKTEEKSEHLTVLIHRFSTVAIQGTFTHTPTKDKI